MEAQRLQEGYYNEDVNYDHGSPHLSDVGLRDRLVSVLYDTLSDIAAAGLPLRVLEIGAGHGGYTEPTLAAGCEVTAVEMSRPALRVLTKRFATNPRLEGVLDADGSLLGVGEGYSLILAVSVLHHIPDYTEFLKRALQKLRPGGSVLTLQDPLWYPRVSPLIHMVDRAVYLVWRAGQGDLDQGFDTMSRRVRRVYDDSKAADMVEYHVVRQGVDESGISLALNPLFAEVRIVKYWSNQLQVARKVAERFGWVNTFGIRAKGYKGQ